MEVTVRKWGNSLGVRIPKIMVKDLNLEDGSLVEIEEKEGVIIILSQKTSLIDLLNGINESNMHTEIDFGAPTGKEIW